jgi:hypothetical protein
MSGFKLLAIRPMEGCDEQFLKNLKPGMVYKFYQDYKYYVGKDEIDSKNYDKFSKDPISKVEALKSPLNIYSENGLDINVSAVVGKNGSGKSALMELFFFWIFQESVKSGIIKVQEELEYFNQQLINNFENTEYPIDTNYAFGKSLECGKILDYAFREINIEVFIECKNEIICFRKNIFCSNFKIMQINHVDDLRGFFYSISLNYSIYGLNSNNGIWLNRLFHKNDGYLTPLVINPKREDGNIDINLENQLANSRILANLVDEKTKEKIILEMKKVEFLEFELPHKTLETDFCEIYKEKYDNGKFGFSLLNFPDPDNSVKEILKTHGEKDNISIFYFLGLTDEEINKAKTEFGHELFENIESYTKRKLFKIVRTYREFEKYLVEGTVAKIPNLKDFISKMNDLKSHKTLKIRQIVNTIKYCFLSNKSAEQLKNDYGIINKEGHVWNDRKFQISIKDFAKLLLEHKENQQIIELIPNAFFKVRVKFKGEAGFENFSSGEQQFINAITTIIYHVLNIDSNNKYTSVNIIFDEVELYFHPDYQRKFIKELLDRFRNLRLKSVKSINILFLTHSPFILSDIPSSNILCLEDGAVSGRKVEQTFGANIHDLLANSFFLEKGFMGEYAKKKIESLIDFLDPNKKLKTPKQKTKNGWNLQKAEEFIDIIGEPFLKADLQELLMEYKKRNLGEKERLEDEIKYLTLRLKNLEK